MTRLFAITLFLSAALLFLVQPMIARMLLPLLGGASSVWTTCMVFYQVTLLLGYAYAHVVSRHLSVPVQLALQLMLMLVALALLPFTLSPAMLDRLQTGSSPLTWLLSTLVLVAGLPFFITSTIGPLLQRWFSRMPGSASGDPYFLYAASNLGSLLALAAYPLWFEQRLALPDQGRAWRWGFLALVILIATCGACLIKRAVPTSGTEDEETNPPTWRRRFHWLLLAFVPSSLMLGVTTYLTTDVASIPLLWVMPLALYLLTFVLVFSRREILSKRAMNRALPILGIILVFTILSRATEPTWFLLLIHLLFFFTAAFVSHSRLAADRPPVGQLTGFYLWMSAGGALGGVFNALLAPMLFRGVVEYPLVILLACALYIPLPWKTGWRAPWIRWLPVAGITLLTTALAIIASVQGLVPGVMSNVVIFGLPVVLCFPLTRTPWRFATALALVMVTSQTYVEHHKRTLFLDRSFYGVSRVALTMNGRFRQLDHGNTTHGRQFADRTRGCEPLAYYHHQGPLGSMLREFNRAHPNGRVALVGLGAGAALTYALPRQSWTVYEIDPLVIRIAQDPELFSFLGHCTSVQPEIILGDARLQLARANDAAYDLIVLDAFSSDSIPIHLLTSEAFDLYFEKLAPEGWIALHLSNRYLDLERVIAGMAAEKGLAGLSWIDLETLPEEGKEESQWVLLSRREELFRNLNQDPNRIPLEGRPATKPWSDQQSSLLPIFKW